MTLDFVLKIENHHPMNLEKNVTRESLLKWSLIGFGVLVVLALVSKISLLLKLLPVYAILLIGLVIYFLYSSLKKSNTETETENKENK